ncbi:MAG TPA: hypothetical protein PK079_26265 [Leptospiraceae bacterium]|nr:hypothetical protein [Leptospiraceae bacterium]HNE56695.1 hypothetical protein [Leptospiraceae bacterium]
MNLEKLLLATLSQDAYYQVNKQIVKELGFTTAIVLSFLIDKYKYFLKEGQLDNQGGFFLSAKKLNEETGNENLNVVEFELGIGEVARRSSFRVLTQKGLIRIEKKGHPARHHYYINSANILQVLSSPTDTKVTSGMTTNTTSPTDTKVTSGMTSAVTYNKNKEEEQKTITKNNPISTSLLIELKSKIKKINENLKIPYMESNKANELYDKAAKNYEGNFDELFQDTLKKLLDLSTKPLDKFSPIRKGVSIQSLTAFNCELMGAIAIEHTKVFPKSNKVEVVKEVLPEKDQHEKEIVYWLEHCKKQRSRNSPITPIDKLALHLQQDTRIREFYGV